jgi:hypothetical protein
VTGHVSQYRLAIVYMGLGEREQALDHLQYAVKERSPGVVHLKVSPLFIEFRANPQFQQLLKEMGLSGQTG